MCNVCPLVLYYDLLAKTTQNIIVGLFVIIRRILIGICNCIVETIRCIARLLSRIFCGVCSKYQNTCPNTDCKLQTYEIMCSVSCLLVVIAAIFMVVFHTQWVENFLGKCHKRSEQINTPPTDQPSPATTSNITTPYVPTETTTLTTETTTTKKNPRRIGDDEVLQIQDDSSISEVAMTVKDELDFGQEIATTAKEELEIPETDKNIYDQIGTTTDETKNPIDNAYFNEIHETTANVYIDNQNSNLSDVKEFVKEKQSMSKVLSLLEEILTNMSSKKKFERMRLNNVFSTNTYDDNSVESADETSKNSLY